MNDNSDLLPNLSHEDAFEVQMRGYSRRQVDEFIARCRSQIRDLEQRLAQALDDGEDLKRDLATARQQALGAKPAHEEVSERIAQILKLADDEARSQKSKAHEEIARQRNDAQSEAEKIRTEAREQAERMLTAAQEQAERAITSARSEAEKTLSPPRAPRRSAPRPRRGRSRRRRWPARRPEAKKALDEATAPRATAIHDGAERRLNLLSTRHSETIKRLTDILDGGPPAISWPPRTARMSLEDRGRPGHRQVDRRVGVPRVPRARPPSRPRSAGSSGPARVLRVLRGQYGPRPGGPRSITPHPAPCHFRELRDHLSGPPRRPSRSQAQPGQSPSDPSRPGQSRSPQSPSAQSPSAQSPGDPVSRRPRLSRGCLQDKQHAPGRSAVIDADEQAEGVRLMPGRDDFRALPCSGSG